MLKDQMAAGNNGLSYETFSPQATSALWQVHLDRNLSSKAQRAALFVAERLRDPEAVKRLARQASNTRVKPAVDESQSSLPLDSVGITVMYDYVDRCFPGQGWDACAERYLRLAAADTQQVPLVSPALFGGTGGMVLALSLASRGGIRYQKTLASLCLGLGDQVRMHVGRRPECDGGVAWGDYDLMVGAAGILTSLISIGQPENLVHEPVGHLLTYLTWLAEPDQPAGKERWYVPPALTPKGEKYRHFLQGHFNCGLAHGIPGSLAALALSWLAGYRYPALRESIAYLAHWLVDHQVPDWQGAMSWPYAIPFEAAASSQEWNHLPATRTAWCYGAPGVARSLWLAGQVLRDNHLLQVAVEAIEGVLRLPVQEREIPSPTICHGIAGLLQICLRFAHESESTLVKEQIPILVEQLLDAFHPTLALGFRDVDQGDQPDCLTGAAGVAMVLLAASTPITPTWDRILAIA